MKGSIQKRGKKWAIVVYLGMDESGKKKQKWYSGYSSQKEAHAALPDILQAVKNNRVVNSNDITVKEFLDMWLSDHVGPNLGSNTWVKYQTAADRAAAAFGGMAIQKVKPYHLQRWVNAMNGSRLKKSSVIAYYKAINTAFNKALAWQIIGVTPCTNIALPKIKKKTMSTYTTREITQLLAATEGHPLNLVILLAVSCGLRRGEILGLKWRRVNMEAQTLQIEESLAQTSRTNGPILQETKSDGSRRLVDFGNDVKKALLQQRARQLEALTSQAVVDITALGEDGLRDLHVCTWGDLSVIKPAYVSNNFGKVIKKAGLPKTRFHDLRHTHATLLLQAGVHPKVVQERLGHTKISITMDTYSHVLPSMQKEAARLLNF